MNKLSVMQLEKEFEHGTLDYQDILSRGLSIHQLKDENILQVDIKLSMLNEEILDKYNQLDDLENNLYEEIYQDDEDTQNKIWDIAYDGLDTMVDFESVEEFYDCVDFNYDYIFDEAYTHISVEYNVIDDIGKFKQ